MTDDCEYVELHTASAFNFFARASQPEELAEQAARLEMPVIALADRNGLYLELQRHQQRDEEFRNQSLLSLASTLRLPLIATNGVRYATEKDRELLDAFTTIRHHTSFDQAGRSLTPNASRSLRSAPEMPALFSDIREAFAKTRTE